MSQGYLLSVYGSLLRLSMDTATSGSCILLSLPRLENTDKEIVPSGFLRVLENLESPEILSWHFPGLESPGKRLKVLESPGNLLKSRNKVFRIYVVRNTCRSWGELILKSLEWEGWRRNWVMEKSIIVLKKSLQFVSEKIKNPVPF